MVDARHVESREPVGYSDTLGKYLVIYACILVLAALQFVIAYAQIDATTMFVRMLFVAIAEAGLALLFFMHLWAEKRGFMLFVFIFTVFVLLAMQYGWTDSHRMQVGAPYSQPAGGAQP
ncbi:MAG TPA: cytochrome C oxidase subunit IV family protein [Terriglobales bacterium]|nr:cytochrome C oxidase subunit IV family protein [Terriglobales bacterium]